MKKIIFSIAAIAVVIAPVFADDLWNQQTLTSNGDFGYGNAVEGDLTTQTFYGVSEVNNNSAWTINSISLIAESSSNLSSILVNTAVLNVFDDGATDPPGGGTGDDPTTGTTVNVTATLDNGLGTNPYGGGYFIITASGLNINLTSGSHWIGLTPNSTIAQNGYLYVAYNNSNLAGATFGDAFRNPYALSGDWVDVSTAIYNRPDLVYGAMDIQGTVQSVPSPSAMAFLALGVGALLLNRHN